MKTLNTIIEDDAKRGVLITDCAQLVDQEVKSKGGLTGIAVKTAYGIVKAIKPSMITDTVDALLDEWTEVFDGFYKQFQEQGENGSLGQFINGRPGDVAEGLLGVTDKRAQKSTNKTIVKAYGKLRPKGKTHVEAAVPNLGRLLDKHVATL